MSTPFSGDKFLKFRISGKCRTETWMVRVNHVNHFVGRDNTVKYRWRTLQLLPGMDRPSYAGAVVDVLEGLDGQLAVQHEGRIIPTQEAPQRPNILRNFTERTAHTPARHLHSNGLGRRWADKLAQFDVEVSQDDADSNGAGRARKAGTPRRRKPTSLQTARWRAV